MDATANALNWFEISVSDLERAKKFYEEIFSFEMHEMEMMEMKMAMFPIDNMSGKVGGALAHSAYHKPSTDGVKIYLNANPDMDAILARIEGAGGQVMMPKTKISDEIGFMAGFVDSEGNHIALHSNQ